MKKKKNALIFLLVLCSCYLLGEQICNTNIKENFNIHFESIKEKHLHNRKMFLELKERLLKNYEKNII